MRDSNFCQI